MRALLACLTLAPLILLRAEAQEPEAPRTSGGFAPLGYFQDNCARCHGDYGAAYGDQFGAKLSAEEILKVVKAMADGPAQAPLNAADLDLESAFHLALRDKKPFIVASKWENGQLSGEAMPGSTVTFVQGKTVLPLALDGHQWVLDLKGKTWQGASIRAEKSGLSVEWPLDKVNTAP